jgi:hypothetical protein
MLLLMTLPEGDCLEYDLIERHFWQTIRCLAYREEMILEVNLVCQQNTCRNPLIPIEVLLL